MEGLPYLVTISDKSYHKIKYCDENTEYFAKNVRSELRGENATEALNFLTETVSGTVDFN